MTWERFGYICRKVAAGIREDETVSDCIGRVEKSESCAYYGDPLHRRSLPKKILDKVALIDSKERALATLNIYQEFDLVEKFEEPIRFKRVVAYLSYVTFIFYIVVGIYQVKVAPTFLNAFNDFELSVPRHLGWYQDYWGYIVLVVSILLIASLVIGHNLRKLFRFDLGIENGFVFKYLVFRSIRTSYKKVMDILQFPISEAGEPEENRSSELVNHLKEVEASEMSVAVEMQALLRVQMRVLLEKSEQQMKLISVFVALVVVTAIFFFLASAYSPIFFLGEIV
ncbi:hypothetical protein [Reinekea blandensis]|uniref:Uncharacterized protein n=1 Tax=Reinekea blandensis MED297 TaxID=314283 RepID=A4BFZ1_9GAMM|nr:hypothetical protein [Reinekea blandensis]EAR09009.1 hypothetical protein MED297_03932 [Reinekea sp. MED297] [Reinekea blandensis MED297]